MKLPKFIITMDGVFRLGMVDQHKHLLKPGDQCIGGGHTQDEIRTVVNAVLGALVSHAIFV